VPAGAPQESWARAEFLNWWVKDAPVAVPLVTTGDPTVGFPIDNSAGGIGQPGTVVLFGNSDVDFGGRPGARLSVGHWLDAAQSRSIEGSAFFLDRGTRRFSASSDDLGNPPLYFPAFNVVAGAERGNPISDPLRGFAGYVAITSGLGLWGTDIDTTLKTWVSHGTKYALRGGLCYANLDESLQIDNTTRDLLFDVTQVAQDRFATRNEFFGGQVAGRATFTGHRLSADLTAKLAVGNNHQTVNVLGTLTQTGAGAFAPGTSLGGIYAQPTNIGRRESNDLTVIPSLQVQAIYQVTPKLSARIGYDALFWGDVVRPGKQIDHNINPSQSPTFGTGTLAGIPAPAPLFGRSDFWAQGISVAVEVRF
jgi:hypothetical protein